MLDMARVIAVLQPPVQDRSPKPGSKPSMYWPLRLDAQDGQTSRCMVGPTGFYCIGHYLEDCGNGSADYNAALARDCCGSCGSSSVKVLMHHCGADGVSGMGFGLHLRGWAT
jgi:hypothetical protein